MSLGDIDQDAIAAFEADGATAFPYVLTGDKLPPNVVEALSHLGVKEGDNTMTAAIKVSNSHTAFHPAQL